MMNMNAYFTDSVVATGALTAFLILMALAAAAAVFTIIGRFYIFRKMGVAGWKSLIPGYSLYTQYAMTWKTSAALAAIACGILGYIASAMNTVSCAYAIAEVMSIAAGAIMLVGNIKLAKSFGHGAAFGFGLSFLSPIFCMILAFGKDTYIGKTTDTMQPTVQA